MIHLQTKGPSDATMLFSLLYMVLRVVLNWLRQATRETVKRRSSSSVTKMKVLKRKTSGVRVGPSVSPGMQDKH